MRKSGCEMLIAVVIIVFTLWESVYDSVGKWVLLIAGIILLIHSFSHCRKCFACDMDHDMSSASATKPRTVSKSRSSSKKRATKRRR